MNRGVSSPLLVVLVLLVVVLLSTSAGASGGYWAALSHPVPRPTGPQGPPGPAGPRRPAGHVAQDTQGGICVSDSTSTNYQAIPPATTATDVRVSSPFGGSCAG